MQLMKKIQSGFVQGQLFASRAPAEQFRVDETSGVVTRSVTLRDPYSEPCQTVIGDWDRRSQLDDIRAIADLSYLQRKYAPTAGIGDDIRVVDLFAGCGAMSLGVSEACRAIGRRFVAAGAIDIMPRVLEVYARNFGDNTAVAMDIEQVLLPDLDSGATQEESALLERLGSVDFVVAGPPCQGHSNLNNHSRRDDPKNALYFLVARFAKLFRPRWIIIENVISVRHDKGDVVNRTQSALESLGYETTDGIVDLWSIGVAQTRRRHMLIAQLRPSTSGPRTLPDLPDLIAPYVTRPRPVRWAIEDLLNVSDDTFMDKARLPDDITRSRIDYLFEHGLYDLPKSQRPNSHRGEHGDSYKAVYGRMHWDDPAPTMTGGFSTMGQGRFVHPKRRRTITPHEAARVQYIPDFFDFAPIAYNRGTLSETIGNAVPPKLSYVLALELLR